MLPLEKMYFFSGSKPLCREQAVVYTVYWPSKFDGKLTELSSYVFFKVSLDDFFVFSPCLSEMACFFLYWALFFFLCSSGLILA